MSLKSSIKISGKGISFLKKFRTNRRKMDIDDEDLSYWRIMDIIVEYFKNNNDQYLEMVATPHGEKNV